MANATEDKKPPDAGGPETEALVTTPGASATGSSAHRSRNRWRTQGVILLALGCGGALGALGRYAVAVAVPTPAGQFPWATFAANISGSALLGLLLVLLIEQFPRGRLARPVVATGVLGAYTTFSTFVVESVQLFRDSHPLTALAYLAASVAAGLAAVWLGMLAARGILRAERYLAEQS